MKDKILKATGTELSRLAGHVLNDTSEHCVAEKGRFDYICKQCNRVLYSKSTLERCWCIATPIPITWDNAMKWRDWAVEKYGIGQFLRTMQTVMSKESGRYTRLNVIFTTAQPKHYLKAAMLCKLKGRII